MRSQRIRERIEEGFGWGEEFGLLRRIRVRGRERVGMLFSISAAACNLIRLPRLLAGARSGMRCRSKKPSAASCRAGPSAQRADRQG